VRGEGGYPSHTCIEKGDLSFMKNNLLIALNKRGKLGKIGKARLKSQNIYLRERKGG